MDEITAKFLPRFAALSRDRLTRAIEVATARRKEGAEQVARELHALAGEAGLLGLEQVTGVARRAEEAARRFAGSAGGEEADELLEWLQKLERAVTEATTDKGM
jgi:HPt (histidine-containing phosphotransfer) domain-containing protein